MIKLMIGYNFDLELIDQIKDLNKKYQNNNIQVIEFYGSMPRLTARPAYRLPKIKNFRDHIKKIHNANFSFNYTMNANDTTLWFKYNEKEVLNLIDFIYAKGVDRFTFAHNIPLLVLKNNKRSFPVELSTILNIDDFNELDYYIQEYSFVDKICLSIYKNRDPYFLKKACKITKNYNKNIELLVNEFCILNNNTPCIYRNNCYEIHSFGGNKKYRFKNYPHMMCTESRFKNPVSWLKAKVIYPWNINYYNKTTGISNYKISGRTMPTKYILNIVEAYLSLGKVMDDNLLALWGHMEVKNKKADLMKIPKRYPYISVKKLKELNFNPIKLCRSSNICGIDCKYCDKCYEKLEIIENYG